MTRAEKVTAVADTLVLPYGILPAAMTKIRAGTSSLNHHATTRSGEEWFARVYRDPSDLAREPTAAGLTQLACDDGIPVPAVRRETGPASPPITAAPTLLPDVPSGGAAREGARP
ncbi:hypothetical protein OIE62_06905 [Streptomyces scopuliridis]|uniref:Uncharacterized protein n=1 Tax=Streptomyces scopuliridis TaxID=452529 RepID=A0ACD4ZTY7_9ACTN|nr:hypothetical protein [Streptomyces scopuliridis]WSC01690.1 hypothetical protein OG835_34915 [Streptomyces scopuliridis]WSC04771.1 hypothetical protein OIE62_06905 [Streptomyces scopuliridis]